MRKGITWYKMFFFSKASSEEENSPSPPPVAKVEPNLISEEARMIEDEVDHDLDDISLTQEEKRKAYGGDPRTSQMAGVGIVKDEIDDLSDEDSDLVIDEPEEEDTTTRGEYVESDSEERPKMEKEEQEMKPSLPSVMFLADQRALLQPKTELLQRKPEQAIQPKSRGGGGVGAQSRAPPSSSSNTQAASSAPAAPAPFNFNLDILAAVASMNR